MPGSLTRVDLQLARQEATSEPLQFELRTATGDVPIPAPSGLLFSGAIPASEVSTAIPATSFTVSIDLSSAGPAVEPGDTLAILLSTESFSWYLWSNSGYFNSNPYADGTAIQLTPGNPDWVPAENWDFGFRTWVTPIPEPSTCALLIVGGCCLLAWKRQAAPGLDQNR